LGQRRRSSFGSSLLSKKTVQPHGIKTSEGKLIVPLYDQDNTLHTLQFIDADGGEKKFLQGGRTLGCYYPLGEEPNKTLYIAEGFATAATIQEITKESVAVAFNANNLKPVAKSLRQKFPSLEIVICADDDHMKKENVGLSKAIEAATESRSKISIPDFDETRERDDSDFNDLLRLSGVDQVKKSIEKVYSPDELEASLASKKLKQVLRQVKEGDFGAFVEKDVIPVWRHLKKTDRAGFERFRKELKIIKGVSISALNDALKESSGEDSENRHVADQLVELVNTNAELFHDISNNCYARFINNGHQECWNLESSGFSDWLCYRYFLLTHGAPSETSIKTALGTLKGQAKYECEEKEVFRRVGKDADALWIDLCDENWRAIKVEAGSWEIVNEPNILFERSPSMISLPNPSEEGDIAPLWSLINIPEEDRNLLLCWILECFRVDTPYLVLELIGEQGSAKSKTQDILRGFIDPNQVNLRVRPKNRESLFVSAENSHLVSYENLSHIQSEIQDAFCSLATGGGFADRTLYTNKEETIIEVKRPVVLNGISTLVTAQDLLDRTLHIDVPRIEYRKTEKEIRLEQEENQGKIFGGILDLLANTLKILPSVDISHESLPRMADFAYLGEAVYLSLGHQNGKFLTEYERSCSEGVYRTIESSPVATKLINHIDNCSGLEFRGTIGDLYEELSYMHNAEEAWPKSSRGFGSALRRIAPSLRTLGYQVEVDEKRSNNGYRCYIRKVLEPEEPSSFHIDELIDNQPLQSKHHQNQELAFEEF